MEPTPNKSSSLPSTHPASKVAPPTTLDEAFSRVFSTKALEPFNDWFIGYCSPLKDPLTARRQVSYRRYLVGLSGVQPREGMRVLDAGCGFGPNCIAFYLMGFREIHGLDLFQPMVDQLERYLPHLGLDPFISVRQGDVCDLTSIYGKKFFDLIFSNEALSHYHDPDEFLRQAHLALKPGGVFIVSDNNNGANRRIRRLNQEIWNRFENGPPGCVGIHTVKESYVEMRRRIISESFPELDEATAAGFARSTFRMNREEILDAVRRWREGGEKPANRYRPGVCPLNPETNQTIEELFDPARLARQLKQVGFRDARAYAYLGGATRGGLAAQINNLWRILSPITMRFSNAFSAIGWK
jgi:2-polyprenyl-3-methyl-5-hydroxy-6-metoxy-1,4-benzoquinol methylase